MTRVVPPLLPLALGMALSIAGVAFAGTAVAAPTKAELGAMLKKCSDEADTKGLTVQKGKSSERTAYRRQCMQKNGVAPRKS